MVDTVGQFVHQDMWMYGAHTDERLAGVAAQSSGIGDVRVVCEFREIGEWSVLANKKNSESILCQSLSQRVFVFNIGEVFVGDRREGEPLARHLLGRLDVDAICGNRGGVDRIVGLAMEVTSEDSGKGHGENARLHGELPWSME